MFSTLKKKRSQNLYGKVCSYPMEFAGSTQNPKKKYWNMKSNNQFENFPKEVYLVP
jgi:hypothetical protein